MIGTKGMNKAQKEVEQERRMKVVDRINLLDNRLHGGRIALRMCDKGSADAKKLNAQIKGWEREIKRIKGEENCWLKEAAWFMYA